MQQPSVLLVTPPLTQLNTPYPATAYLKGFLKTQGVEVHQVDLGIELVLHVFTPEFLGKAFDLCTEKYIKQNPDLSLLLFQKERYLATIAPVIAFLQGENPTLAHRICSRNFLPEGKRFKSLQDDMDWAFGTMGLQDRAKHYATLYLEDLGTLIQTVISPHFGFSKYAEKLGLSATSFDPIQEQLEKPSDVLDQVLERLISEAVEQYAPTIVGFSVPFPGNLYGAFRAAYFLKKQYPDLLLAMGGGYANTELRSLEETRVFDYFDFITLDDGESPFLKLIDYSVGKISKDELHRTFYLGDDGTVKWVQGIHHQDVPHVLIGTPDYSDLPIRKYLSVIDMVNPMHRLWNDGRWNKLTVAHGCYWKKCSFCDVSLDYINRYDKAPAVLLVDRMQEVVEQTGESGFHFVDEAAPPAVLRDLAIEIIRRGLHVTWWANIRFDKAFTPDVCKLLAASGCIAVSGGLEVASDRLLKLMQKGVSIEQVANVTRALAENGIMVHAYLMYGFPTQTEQETIDSLEVVRQLFENGIVHSAFWHRFSMTAHSPVGKDPAKYQVVCDGPEFQGFAHNDLWHSDPEGADHSLYGDGLKMAVYNFMHGVCIDYEMQDWFEFEVPETTHPPFMIQQALKGYRKKEVLSAHQKFIWTGTTVQYKKVSAKKKGGEEMLLTWLYKNQKFELRVPVLEVNTLKQLLQPIANCGENGYITLSDLSVDEGFFKSKSYKFLRKSGLLVL